MYAFIGFIASITGWLILIYIGWRNQRVAAKSPLVDKSHIGARIAAIVEVGLHPDHAATWQHPDGTLVFPNLSKDSSEAYGIREDDGKVT
jgi:hypothetical protein